MINLRKVRIERGMTQNELAEHVGVCRQNISNIECGLTKPSIDTAKKIAKVLGVSWENFFCDDEVIINDM